jgi:putative CocE/NonD family hydrolase
MARAASFTPVIERNVPVKMRDGVILRADIYRPQAEGKFPVIVQRTPYNKSQPLPFCYKAATAGYIAIAQDCRGRYASGGDWYPLANEFNDGYDTVEWAAALPYSNGKVGLFGGSYGGFTTLMGALAHPPHLAGFVSIEAGDGGYDGFIYRGGAFQQWLAQSWTSTALAIDSLERATRKSLNVEQWSRTMPPASYPVLEPVSGKTVAPYFFDWLRHPGYDDYWKQWSFEERYAGVTAPGVHVGGWYDVFGGPVPRAYAGMRARAATREARQGQRLIMGPWAHGALFPKAGDLDFGAAVKFDVGEFGLQWFDHLLRGASNGLERQKPVRIFVMGENAWRDEEEWPLARARETRYYLHANGKANSVRGAGVLNPQLPQSESADEYVYDPADPVPTLGGGLCCGGIKAGALDQTPVAERSDVLVYATPPLERELEVTGPVRLELYVSSSAVDTDFTGTLVDVWPNGYAQNLTDGIQRARYRASPERAEFLKPEGVARITVDLWATSNLFRAGHRLRIQISSSNFPRFDRNPNTGDDPSSATRTIKAINKVYHDRERPSAVVLPIVPR